MPIVIVPFEWVVIDIEGLLVSTTMKQQFILVMVDYTTQYLEAIPL